jgi:hypothetical protein
MRRRLATPELLQSSDLFYSLRFLSHSHLFAIPTPLPLLVTAGGISISWHRFRVP